MSHLTRRKALTLSAATAAALPTAAQADHHGGIITPPTGKPLLLAVKLGMIGEKDKQSSIPLADRLSMAAEAGFDGVDLDQAADYTPAEAREAVQKSGVFVHNAINHAHWRQRLTSADPAERDQGYENIAHCLRVSHAAGGSGVLIVVGRASDGNAAIPRAQAQIRRLLPLAASLGQHILIENVWNQMMYDHEAPPEQGPQRFIDFVDSFQSPWVGMYYDIGNHWKYGQPGEWIRAFGHRCIKLDVKGLSRAQNKFVVITSRGDDLPWDQVRKALEDINYHGWATAEVKGGDVARLTTVRKQMQKAFGV
jgi:hexulose-6-phosphate isomerase